MERSDVELGECVLEVERRPRAGVVVSARLGAEEAQALFERARRDGKKVSQIAREAVLAYLRHLGPAREAKPYWTATGVQEFTYSSSGQSARTVGAVQEQHIVGSS